MPVNRTYMGPYMLDGDTLRICRMADGESQYPGKIQSRLDCIREGMPPDSLGDVWTRPDDSDQVILDRLLPGEGFTVRYMPGWGPNGSRG